MNESIFEKEISQVYLQINKVDKDSLERHAALVEAVGRELRQFGQDISHLRGRDMFNKGVGTAVVLALSLAVAGLWWGLTESVETLRSVRNEIADLRSHMVLVDSRDKAQWSAGSEWGRSLEKEIDRVQREVIELRALHRTEIKSR